MDGYDYIRGGDLHEINEVKESWFMKYWGHLMLLEIIILIVVNL
jgi:hypothetical protein